MARKIIFYTISAICFCGFVLLRRYPGELVSNPDVWTVVLGASAFIAAAIGASAKSQKVIKDEHRDIDKVTRLKANGRKIIISLADCEIKENNYTEDVYTDASGTKSLAPLLQENEKPEWKEIDQSVILYNYDDGFSKRKIISPVLNHNALSLSVLIDNKQVILYINPQDANDYFFEVNN